MKIKRLCNIMIVSLLALFSFGYIKTNNNTSDRASSEMPLSNELVSYLNEANTKASDYMFLSDLKLEDESKAGWKGEFSIDKNLDGNNITLNIDGSVKTILKGISAHANATLIYDIGNYSNEYTRFIAYAGINADKPQGNVNMAVYTSKSTKSDWTEVFKYDGLTSLKTQRLDLDITGVKYIKFTFDKAGSDTQDHSLLGNPKLVKPEYKDISFDNLLSIDEYDDMLNSLSVEDALKQADSIYKREFLSRYGDKADLEIMADGNVGMLNTLNWLLTDKDALKLLVEVGELPRGVAPERTYATVLIYLSELYNNFKSDLTDDLDGMNYKKMMIALAMALGGDRLINVLGFRTFVPNFDLIERFENYKYLYKNKFLRKDLFNNYNMELMRLIMNTGISNEEMLWLQGYSEIRYPKEEDRIRYYNYMDYRSPEYHQARYWDLANKEMWDDKYHLDEFNISYGEENVTKYWMAIETGGICWNQSRLGGDLMKVHGIPSVGSFQPGHETVLEYVVDQNGNGRWDHGYNIGGWGVSYGIWFWADYIRTMFNWNIREFARINGNEAKKHSTNYLLVAQDFMNQKSYPLAMLYNYLAKTSKTNERSLEIYNEAIKLNSLNIDAWDGLIKVYMSMEKSSADFKDLADRIIDTFEYHPAVYDDYISIIKPYLKGSDTVYIDSRRIEALNHALTLTDYISLDGKACKDVANALLNTNKEEIISFSFSGDKANTIIVNPKYENQGLTFKYSLNGGISYTKTTKTEILLTEEELKKLTPEFGIFFIVEGVSNPFVIEIKEGSVVGSEIAINDFENTLYGDTTNILYSFDDINYQPFTKSTRFLGDVDVYIKYRAYDNKMEGSSKKISFTSDNYSDKYSYIYTDNVEFISATGNHQGGDAPENLFDGNLNTRYHTQHRVTTKEKVIVIKFNELKSLGMISYLSDGFNGKIKDMNIYVSKTENIDSAYTLVKEVRDLKRDHTPKAIIFDSPVEALYVKLEAINTYGNYDGEINMYLSGQEISFFEVRDIANADILGFKDKLDYTGDPLYQDLKLIYNGEELKEDIDYRLIYKFNLDPGLATLKIEGLGKYNGSVDLSFNIIKDEVLPDDNISGNDSNNNGNNTIIIISISIAIIALLAGGIIFIILKKKSKEEKVIKEVQNNSKTEDKKEPKIDVEKPKATEEVKKVNSTPAKKPQAKPKATEEVKEVKSTPAKKTQAKPKATKEVKEVNSTPAKKTQAKPKATEEVKSTSAKKPSTKKTTKNDKVASKK